VELVEEEDYRVAELILGDNWVEGMGRLPSLFRMRPSQEKVG
jgi:hypothetical protein